MVLATPLNVHWELTNLCNLRCVHCYQQDDGPRGRLPTGEVLDAIAQRIVDASVFELTLTGGEPMLVSQLPRLVRFFNAHGLRPHITSNGMLVDDEAAAWLAEADVTFQVSLDGAGPDTHNAIRNSPRAFSAAVAGIRRLVERGVEVTIAYCATPTNLGELDGVAHLARRLGVGKVCVGEVLPFFGSGAGRKALTTDRGRFAEFVSNLDSLRERHRDSVDVSIALMSGHLHDKGMAATPCTALDRDLAILHDGWAYPCPFVRSPAYRLGNVVEQPLAQVWSGAVARRFRQEKAAGVAKHCTVAGSPADRIPVELLLRRPATAVDSRPVK